MAPKPSNMAPSWNPRGGHTKCFLALLRGLGSSWGQDGPQDGPKTPQEAPKHPFCPDFGGFLLIFHRFLIDFLLVCWLVALLVCWPAGFVGLLLVCWISLPQARWRGWPAGQLDICIYVYLCIGVYGYLCTWTGTCTC